MKRIYFFMPIVFFCFGIVNVVWPGQKKLEYIRIRHVGDVNYPIYPIYIANFQKQELKKISDDEISGYGGSYYWYVTDDDTMDAIIKNLSQLISKLKPVKVPKAGIQFDNGTFLLTIKNNKENGAIVSRSEIKIMVKTIENSLGDKSYDELCSKLNDLKKMAVK